MLRGLAVQDENAACGYYPNSTAFARDNANARDGHYPLWGPSHFYARVDPATNLPLKPGVSQFIDGLNGVTPLPGLDLVAEYASKGLVPECAMHVTRANDGGDYTPFKAPVTCNCYFELHATGSTSCQPCTANADCPNAAPNCNKFGPAAAAGVLRPLTARSCARSRTSTGGRDDGRKERLSLSIFRHNSSPPLPVFYAQSFATDAGDVTPASGTAAKNIRARRPPYLAPAVEQPYSGCGSSWAISAGIAISDRSPCCMSLKSFGLSRLQARRARP